MKDRLEHIKIYYRWCFDIPLVFLAIYVLSYLFFNIKILSLVLAGVSLVSIKSLKRNNIQYINKKVEQEFKVFIYSMSSSLSVGKSFESALKVSLSELIKEKNTFILIDDITKVITNIEANMNIDEAFEQMASKYNIESLTNFSRIVNIALKQGGSLHTIIDKTVSMIDEKTKVENELEVIITQKKFELYILMTFVPLMIIYLKLVSNSFEATMYGTFLGRIMMMISLLMYLFSGFLGRRIVDIEV